MISWQSLSIVFCREVKKFTEIKFKIKWLSVCVRKFSVSRGSSNISFQSINHNIFLSSFNCLLGCYYLACLSKFCSKNLQALKFVCMKNCSFILRPQVTILHTCCVEMKLSSTTMRQSLPKTSPQSKCMNPSQKMEQFISTGRGD